MNIKFFIIFETESRIFSGNEWNIYDNSGYTVVFFFLFVVVVFFFNKLRCFVHPLSVLLKLNAANCNK